MRKYIKYLIVLNIVFSSCAGDKSLKQDEFFGSLRNESPINSISAITLHPFSLEPIESSYVALLDISDDFIYMVDKKFCWIFVFDKNGHFLKRELGQGQGPNELATGMIDGYTKINSNGYLFVGGGNDCHLYNDKFMLKNKYVIDKGQTGGVASYESPWIYTLSYEHLLMKNHGDFLYYTVFSEYDNMNFIESPDSYFANVHYLAKMNIYTGKVEKMLGKYSSIYQESKCLKQFSFVNFDIDAGGTFYVSFESDSLIYTYDKDFFPICSYGYSGEKMQNKQVVFSTFDDFSNGYEQNRAESGYYTGLKYINDTNILFRSYQRGDDASCDGLQIYKDGLLLGDVNVPFGFKIVGYIAPYYYATSGINEEKESVEMFKFII